MLSTVELLGSILYTAWELFIFRGAPHEACKLAIFFSYQFSFTSGLILVTIAISRLFKVVQEEHGVRGHGRGKGCSYRALKVLTMGAGHATNTVKGAKIASVVMFAVAIPITCPTPVLLGKGPGSNCTRTVGSMYENSAALKALHVLHFICYLAIALVLVGVYGTILRRLWTSDRKGDNSDEEPRPRSRISALSNRQSVSVRAMVEALNAEHTSMHAKRLCARTLSEGDAVALVSIAKFRIEPEDSRSVSTPCGGDREMRVLTEMETKELNSRSVSGQGGDSANQLNIAEKETSKDTSFPPVSYSAQLRSLINLNIAKRKEEGKPKNCHRRHCSVMSFQLSNGGNRGRQTTLVFALISAIHILSYLPFFILVLTRSFSDNSGEMPSFGDILTSRLHLMSHISTPIVYVFGNPYFRRTLWKILICRREVI